MKYKLTKGTLSRIRTNKKDIDALIKEGYVLDGKVNDKFEVIDDDPTFSKPKSKPKPKTKTKPETEKKE